MSRIRSVHPGLWTDEAFVEMSMAARLFYIGLWNEADDYGLFEWKPMRLKMRLAPADAIDPAALLAEILSAGLVRRVERSGKDLGLVRNFRKFQRPKSPSSPLVPVDADIIAEIGLREGDIIPPAHRMTGEALPQSSPSLTEISPQMEDGGDKMEEIRWKDTQDACVRPRNEIEGSAAPPPLTLVPEPPAAPDLPSPSPPPDAGFTAFWAAYPHPPNASRKMGEDVWRQVAGDLPRGPVLLDCVAAYRGWLEAERARRGAADPPPVCHASTWLRERRWEGFEAEATAKAAKRREDEKARWAKIPQGAWAAVANRFAARHGWDAWDAAVANAALDGGGGLGTALELRFDRDWSRRFYTERGHVDRIKACVAEAVPGVEMVVTAQNARAEAGRTDGGRAAA